LGESFDCLEIRDRPVLSLGDDPLSPLSELLVLWIAVGTRLEMCLGRVLNCVSFCAHRGNIKHRFEVLAVELVDRELTFYVGNIDVLLDEFAFLVKVQMIELGVERLIEACLINVPLDLVDVEMNGKDQPIVDPLVD
jgi:hypothetical protein